MSPWIPLPKAPSKITWKKKKMKTIVCITWKRTLHAHEAEGWASGITTYCSVPLPNKSSIKAIYRGLGHKQLTINCTQLHNFCCCLWLHTFLARIQFLKLSIISARYPWTALPTFRKYRTIIKSKNMGKTWPLWYANVMYSVGCNWRATVVGV